MVIRCHAVKKRISVNNFLEKNNTFPFGRLRIVRFLAKTAAASPMNPDFGTS